MDGMIKKILKIYFTVLLSAASLFCSITTSSTSSNMLSNKLNNLDTPSKKSSSSVTSLLVPITLKSKFQKAQKGDYLVTLKNDTYTLLIINNLTTEKLSLEEVVLPKSALKKNSSFQKLSNQNYPDALVWNIYEIDFLKNRLLSAYSLKNSASFKIDSGDHFLMKLLTLPLKPQPDYKRKKIGPPPQGGEADRRKLWQPAKFFEGNKIAQAQFKVLETVWPKDGSELSRKTIELYFDDSFPFPYFIQIHASQLTVFLKSVDSGHNFPVKSYIFNSR